MSVFMDKRWYWNIEQSYTAGEFLDAMEDYVLFTVNPPFGEVSKLLKKAPRQIFLVDSLNESTLEKFAISTHGSSTIVGLGGGTVIDAAKFSSWKNDSKFIAIPSVISVNAYLTARAAVRQSNGVVRYTGDKIADLILIDAEFIRSAPRRFNIAGVGDVYSAKTSLMDWKVARDKLQEEYDPEVVSEAENILQRLLKSAGEIRDGTKLGIETLIELQAGITFLQRRYQLKNRKWPEEGSEHVFFYSLERVTEGVFLHGEIVGLGSVIASYLHTGEVNSTIKDLDSFGLKFRPTDIGISREVFSETLMNMKAVAKEMNMFYPTLDSHDFNQQEIEYLWLELGN